MSGMQARMDTKMLMFEAVALHKAVTATYNRMAVTLAPHILYTRHDALHIDATTIERDGQPPREVKLGMFKLDGLKDLALTDQIFTPDMTVFDAHDAKYEGVTLLAVEKEPAGS